MKKLICMALIALMLPAFACAESAPETTGEPVVIMTANELGEMVEWTAPLPGEPVSMEKDLGVVAGGVYYPVFTAAQPLVEALGEPLEQMASPSCVFEGEDREFVYEYGSLYTNPIEGTDIWFDFYITAPGMATSRGLSVGDTVEKMLELYGENFYAEDEDMYTYSLSGVEGDLSSPCLIFESEEGLIVAIDIYYPTNI